MYHDLDEITLKSGETLQAGVVLAPDAEWEERVLELLCHKEEPWNWQNQQVLRSQLGIEVRFYLAHRNGRPVSSVMTAELAGVGILGHVWTKPEERRKGAMSQLMGRQMADFRTRGGRALFLGSDFGSHSYRMYERFGFGSVEEGSRYMAYYASSKAQFERAYFAQGEAEVLPVGWPHWPASPALFVGDYPGVVRCAPLRLFGRTSTEEALLVLLRDEGQRRAEGEPTRALVLQAVHSGAVVGLAVWDAHPLWPETCLLDVYCHPNYWDRVVELLAALTLPDAGRWVAYGDRSCEAKMEALRAAGFRPRATLAKRLAADGARMRFVDVVVLERV